MAIEFSGGIYANPSNEINGLAQRGIDRSYLRRYVHQLEESGFDYTLVPYGSAGLDPFTLAAAVTQHSTRLKAIVAVRANTMYPTTAARQLATIDQLSGGRVAAHFIAGGDDHEQAREGDRLTKAQRYERETEYIQLLRTIWTTRTPFDHEGVYYRFEDFVSDVVPVNDTIPISVGGSSAPAYHVAGSLADIVGLWAEPLADTREQIAQVGQQASAAGRSDRPRPWLVVRPIIAPTDELAWEKAERILGALQANSGAASWKQRPGQRSPNNVGSQRLVALAERGARYDRALWTATVSARGGATTSLVGSPETVATALLDYVDIGVEIFQLRGYDYLNDIVDFGRYLIPLVRQELERREPPTAERDRLVSRGSH